MTEMLTVTFEYAMTKDGVEFWPLTAKTAEAALTTGEIAEGWSILMRVVTTTAWEPVPPGLTRTTVMPAEFAAAVRAGEVTGFSVDPSLTPPPSNLCGIDGCVYMPGHKYQHSWASPSPRR